MLPYFLFTWSMWHLWRLSTRDTPFHELYQGVWIGRRLLTHEYPDTVKTIFDLTAEFPEILAVREGRSYHAYPTLDATPLEAGTLYEAATRVLNADHDVFIHCANGYGRTGSLAAAVLLISGKVNDVEEAIDYLTHRRPALKLNDMQIASVQRFASALETTG
ncbi:MAG: hypothetical protein EP297_14455 [Gammaproteobacteria bacterium]|nr:MAG: hypothetical protein EP297_14455 [Gammaproteobacteria bacterium]